MYARGLASSLLFATSHRMSDDFWPFIFSAINSNLIASFAYVFQFTNLVIGPVLAVCTMPKLASHRRSARHWLRSKWKSQLHVEFSDFIHVKFSMNLASMFPWHIASIAFYLYDFIIFLSEFFSISVLFCHTTECICRCSVVSLNNCIALLLSPIRFDARTAEVKFSKLHRTMPTTIIHAIAMHLMPIDERTVARMTRAKFSFN